MTARHDPVMLDEVVDYLNVRAGLRYVDVTLGEGGHAEAILAASAPDGELLGLDRDSAALASARRYLRDFGERLRTVHAPFAELPAALEQVGWADGADGVLIDLGISSLQLREADRGFSFAVDGPLDMRMDVSDGPTAADLVNELPEREIAQILRRYGEERSARRIARQIAHRRSAALFARTSELREAVLAAGVRGRPGHDPATRTFQALRIAVNDELGQLERFLFEGWKVLRPGGRMVFLSYHSLEDRLVKTALRRWATQCLCPPRQPICNCGWSAKVDLVRRRILRPTDAEISRNPRARSAGLRAVQRRSEDDAR